MKYSLIFWILLILTPLTSGAETNTIPSFQAGIGPFSYRSPVIFGRNKYFDSVRELEENRRYTELLSQCLSTRNTDITDLTHTNQRQLEAFIYYLREENRRLHEENHRLITKITN